VPTLNAWKLVSARVHKVKTELTSAQMRQEAKVPPITNYFDNPLEMITEGTTYFRFGAKTRFDLMRRSPDLYRVVNDLDHLEIEKAHGLKPDGGANLIRNPVGFLVENNEENRLLVESFEKNPNDFLRSMRQLQK
jgi:hypothetical protein